MTKLYAIPIDIVFIAEENEVEAAIKDLVHALQGVYDKYENLHMHSHQGEFNPQAMCNMQGTEDGDGDVTIIGEDPHEHEGARLH